MKNDVVDDDADDDAARDMCFKIPAFKIISDRFVKIINAAM